jgi:hypothetical protein
MEEPGVFVASDIFEVQDGLCSAEITLRGARRLADSARAHEERNMAICYYWNAAQLAKIAESGTLVNPSPAPINAERLTVVLRQLSLHPKYKHQLVLTVSHDLTVVTMKDGKITAR